MDPITSDFRSGADWFAEMTLLFTLHETRLLWALKRANGQPLSRQALYKAMTGRTFFGSNVVDAHLGRMRPKALGMGMLIITERGAGWRMVEVERKAA